VPHLFDPSGIYPYQIRNAKEQISWMVFHAGLGVMVEAIDPNYLVFRRRYDGFGQLRDRLRSK
jgi:hypothetical protein